MLSTSVCDSESLNRVSVEREQDHPRLQILVSAFDLFRLGLRRFKLLRDLSPDQFVDDACACCGDRVLAMKHFGSRRVGADESLPDSAEYRCTAVGSADYPPVFSCLKCGLEQVPASLVPSSLESTYENVVDRQYLENLEVRERTYERSFDQLHDFLPSTPGTLLEVGAYCGLFLKEAVRRGWDARGIEPSKWASSYARETSGVRVTQGFLTDEPSGDPHDVVVSWDVLEHVRDPVRFLQQCGAHLKPDGLLALSTLDVDTWFPRMLGTRWPWLINMHLFYFSSATMRRVFDAAGFDLVHVAPYAHYARVSYALTGLLRSLPGWLRMPASWFIRLVPKGWMLPVALGDIKLFIARKRVSVTVTPDEA